MCAHCRDVRFSNRPFGVKHFQTIHPCSVDVAHGLVLLFGIGTKALPSWDSKTRWNDLLVGLAVEVTAGLSGPSRRIDTWRCQSKHRTDCLGVPEAGRCDGALDFAGIAYVNR